MKKKVYKITALLLATSSDNRDSKKAEAPQIDGLTYESTMDLTYAQEFDVFYYKEGYKLIDVHEGRQYLIVPEGKEAPEGLDEKIIVIQQPIQNIYMAATAIMSLFDALDAIDTVKFSGLEASGWYIESAKKADFVRKMWTCHRVNNDLPHARGKRKSGKFWNPCSGRTIQL